LELFSFIILASTAGTIPINTTQELLTKITAATQMIVNSLITKLTG
jgi:hypothetical protein